MRVNKYIAQTNFVFSHLNLTVNTLTFKMSCKIILFSDESNPLSKETFKTTVK